MNRIAPLVIHPAEEPPPEPTRSRVVVLGPQRHEVTLDKVVSELDLPAGRVATITAGWEEREQEIDELNEALGGQAINLRLFERTDRVFAEDSELLQAHRDLQRQLRERRRLYNIRLAAAMDAVFLLLKHKSKLDLVKTELAAALDTLRDLDAWHADRVRLSRSEFARQWHPTERPAVQRQRQEIADEMAEATAVAIAGGHVATLLDHMHLFGLRELLEGKTLIAWSAGAMVLTQHVVLFHDSPPQGPGHAEVLEDGLGLVPRLVALPHGRTRLQLHDAVRVERFARRFAPDTCALLETGTRLEWDGDAWSSEGVICLEPDGRLEVKRQW